MGATIGIMHTTEAEQNRLIIENMDLAEKLSAGYRGQKGIPFEDLVAEARAGLVLAAREWLPGLGTKFTTFAIEGITNHLINFIRQWQHLEVVGEKSEDEIERLWFEWTRYFVCPYESWTSLVATPEELVIAFEQTSADRLALSNAMWGLSRREKRMIQQRFFDRPAKTLTAIAQDHRISYARTVYVLKRAIERLRETTWTIQERRSA